MKILMSTPAFGGILTTRWFQSFLETMAVMASMGHDFSVITMDRDGLISRARNSSAEIALEMGFDKLLFVDADVVWKPEQILMLLKSDKKIVGGTYPYKGFPLKPVFNALPEHTDVFNEENRSAEAFMNYSKKYANQNGEVEVYNLPTGFMMIDVSVFKELSKVRPRYRSFDAVTKTKKIAHDFFPVGLREIEGDDILDYETEDWGFCSAAKEVGFKIYLQTKCVVDHLGFHQFSIGI